jgi:hypothetical protein
VTFRSKYDERTERMSIRVPTPLKNHIWKAARKRGMSATDVVIDILTRHYAGAPPAPQWAPGTTKAKKDKTNEEDIFA